MDGSGVPMSNWADGMGTARAMCRACAGRRLVFAAGNVELCPICGGMGRVADAGDELGPSSDETLRPGRVAAIVLLLAAVAWPALRFFDFALHVFLAYVI
jgi:hypothetical protein